MPSRRPPARHRPLTLATAAGVISLVLPSVTLIRIYTANGFFMPIVYSCLLSGITFLTYGYDKIQARNREWRVKEVTLHTLSAVGGWPGALAGMHYFQHKTRKPSFQIVFWTIVMGWQGVAWGLWTGKIGFW
ncbi:hypothetical protein BKA66DRAFT_165340 [Pyrenochaeta sp. MPI-SDFR-AT-0127]|nr:hypothetical protein BKA66DRAFT_165340 [Pyrenochaeta sp. MPI-SDFR-AT-0127]